MTTVDTTSHTAVPRPRKVPGLHFSADPASIRWRRGRLEYPAIVEYLRDWQERDPHNGMHWAAVGLIEMTGMLKCSAEERVELVERVLGALEDVQNGVAS